MTADEAFALTVWLAAFGAVLRWGVLRIRGGPSDAGSRVRAVKRARRVPIRDAADGATVKLTGTARFTPDVVAAPFTGRPCSCYVVALFRRASMDYGPETRGEAEGARSFFVEDETGRARVEVGAATAIVPRMRTVGERHGGWEELEWALVEGDTVTVSGRARWENDLTSEDAARGDYRSVPRLLVVDASVILP
jgi:hypothetical protein